MKKEIKIALIILVICLFIVSIISGIIVVINHNKLKDLPDDPIVFKCGELSSDDEDTGYKTIEYNDKIYIIYGSIKSKGLSGDISYAYGNCLGYVENDKSDRIYALSNASSDEWLIEYYVDGMMEQPAVLREISAKGNNSIPDSVESFSYEYWK